MALLREINGIGEIWGFGRDKKNKRGEKLLWNLRQKIWIGKIGIFGENQKIKGKSGK